jgi:hypothetical protein
MKYEVGFNDCLPEIEVTLNGNDGDLVVRYFGFAHDEAKQWFDSMAVMDSLATWHSVLGNFKMSVSLDANKQSEQ